MPTAPSTTIPQNGTAPLSMETGPVEAGPVQIDFPSPKAQLRRRIRLSHISINQLLLVAGALGLGTSHTLRLDAFDGNIVLIEAGLSLYFAGGLYARNLTTKFAAGVTALISGITTLTIFTTQIATGEVMGWLWAVALAVAFLWAGTSLLRHWFGHMLARFIAVATS